MILRLLCIMLAIVCVISVSYQDRGIYYNEVDNVCHVTPDLILLRYNIDGLQTVTHTAWGETVCREGEIYYWKIVRPSKRFKDADDGFNVDFAQDTKQVYISGVLKQIIQRTTVTNALIRNVPYACQIVGDGEVQHFGIDIPNSPPCQFYIKCTRETSDQ